MRELEAAHRLRGSALPQHRRVLAPRHGDVHDHGRRLHARVRLLQRHARRAGRARSATSPTTSRTPSTTMELAYVVVTSVDRDDLAGLRRRRVRGDDSRDQGAAARVPRRSADPRFSGQRGAAAHGARRAARRAQPQHRDGAAALSRGAARRPLPARARAARPRAPLGAGHSDQDRPHGRPRRDRATRSSTCSRDLRKVDCQILTIGQYLRPSVAHLPMDALLHARRVPRAQAHRARPGLRPRRVRAARAEFVSRARAGGECTLREHSGRFRGSGSSGSGSGGSGSCANLRTSNRTLNPDPNLNLEPNPGTSEP